MKWRNECNDVTDEAFQKKRKRKGRRSVGITDDPVGEEGRGGGW